MANSVHFELSGDESLVLFDFLARWDDEDVLPKPDAAEELALVRVLACLEKQLVEIFSPEYKALLDAARQRLRDVME